MSRPILPDEPEDMAREFITHFPERISTLFVETQLRDAVRRRKPSILMACMLKSGSTFLCNALAAATGYPRHPLVYAFFQNAQDLYLPALARAIAIPTITQQHVRATRPNLELIDIFHLKTIVLVRNVFDAIVSLRDHCLREGPEMPAGIVTDQFERLSTTEQYDLLIDVSAPWFFGFYASWFAASQAGKCDPVWVTYETFFADPESALESLLEFAETPRTRTEVSQALQQARSEGSRLNRGVGGRGQTELTPEQRDRIVRLSRWYPSVDFQLMGISQETQASAA